MGEPAAATATETITGTIERENISPAQFLAEMEAAGVKTTVEDPPAEGAAAKPGDVETKTDDKTVDPNGDKPDAEVKPAEVEAKADEPPPEAKPGDSDAVKAARKIYAAAGRKEAAALKLEQENKSLKATLADLAKLRDEDPIAFLQAVGMGQGAEKDPVKDLLRRVVEKGEKPAPTIEEKFEALQKQLAEEKTQNTKRSEEAVIAASKARIASEVKAAGDKFDLVNAFEDYDGVTDVMEAYFEAHGVACGTEHAAAAREKFHQDRLAKSTKFKAAGPAALAAKPATTSTGNKPASTAMGKSETLTNTESGSKDLGDELPMDDHDARARAAAKELGLAFIRN